MNDLLNVQFNNNQKIEPKKQTKKNPKLDFIKIILEKNREQIKKNQENDKILNKILKQIELLLAEIKNKNYPVYEKFKKEISINSYKILNNSAIIEKNYLAKYFELLSILKKIRRDLKLDRIENLDKELSKISKSLREINPDIKQATGPAKNNENDIINDFKQKKFLKPDKISIDNKKTNNNFESFVEKPSNRISQNIFKESNINYSLEYLNNKKLNFETDLRTDNNLKNINHKEVFDQLVEKAKVILKNNQSEIIINLKPEFLGKVTLKLQLTNENQLSGKIIVDSAFTQKLFIENFTELKIAFQNMGLQLNNFDVLLANHNKDSFDNTEYKFLNNLNQTSFNIEEPVSELVENYDIFNLKTGIVDFLI